MFGNSLTVAINAVNKTLASVGYGDRTATYESLADGLVMKITHVVSKRHRHTIRLDITKTAPDPFVADLNRDYSMSAYLVVDAPKAGFSLAEQKLNVKGLTDWIGTSTNLDRVLAGES